MGLLLRLLVRRRARTRQVHPRGEQASGAYALRRSSAETWRLWLPFPTVGIGSKRRCKSAPCPFSPGGVGAERRGKRVLQPFGLPLAIGSGSVGLNPGRPLGLQLSEPVDRHLQLRPEVGMGHL